MVPAVCLWCQAHSNTSRVALEEFCKHVMFVEDGFSDPFAKFLADRADRLGDHAHPFAYDQIAADLECGFQQDATQVGAGGDSLGIILRPRKDAVGGIDFGTDAHDGGDFRQAPLAGGVGAVDGVVEAVEVGVEGEGFVEVAADGVAAGETEDYRVILPGAGQQRDKRYLCIKEHAGKPG